MTLAIDQRCSFGDERLPQRFWSKIELQPDGCWTWTGYRQPKGYGAFRHEGHPRPAHRVAYSVLVGAIPDGLVLDHLCRVRPCVNPDHLRAVTSRENTFAAGSEAPALILSQKESCVRGHALGGPNLIPSAAKIGHRQCLACNRTQGQRRWAEHKGQSFDFQAASDANYRRILLEATA